MMMSEDTQISAVSETLFLPLYSLALESQRTRLKRPTGS